VNDALMIGSLVLVEVATRGVNGFERIPASGARRISTCTEGRFTFGSRCRA
jgi:hypothetical protein